MNSSIDSAEICTLIPHSGLMCLLESVLTWDDESIICASETHRDPANPLRRGSQLSALHALEYAAQAAAVHGGLRARAAGTRAPAGYLVALRDVHLKVARLDTLASPLRIQARRLFGDGPNTMYGCEVFAGNLRVADGRITIMLRQ